MVLARSDIERGHNGVMPPKCQHANMAGALARAAAGRFQSDGCRLTSAGARRQLNAAVVGHRWHACFCRR